MELQAVANQVLEQLASVDKTETLTRERFSQARSMLRTIVTGLFSCSNESGVLI
jgi:hypothetical protein